MTFKVRTQTKRASFLLLSLAFLHLDEGVASDVEKIDISPQQNNMIIRAPIDPSISMAELYKKAKTDDAYKELFFDNIFKGLVSDYYLTKASLSYFDYFDHNQVHNFSSRDLYVFTKMMLRSKDLRTINNVHLLVDALKKYVDLNDPIAQVTLGLIYQIGLIRQSDRDPLEPNHKEAFKYYKLSALQEFDKAQYYIGGLYYKGLGVPVCYKMAAMCFEKAAQQGMLKRSKLLDSFIMTEKVLNKITVKL